ncbi:hypothetical protein TREMEDRAFT_27360, partial [Tremella mesenterica DSM 1558]|uniref:uncharacterized protein n=1 Tax=Tremella mesenterica (strain ATCC 24925 / CBS 8224 / DSM 1558 / NBRC 9311 / NRRL Y-6157 / RJB 2259-6 / UBC 559-6) TaxID=578456 RepID=UPI0003F48D4D
MGLFWRPEVLGNAFAGDTIDAFNDLLKDPKGNVRSGPRLNPALKDRVVPDAGPDGPRKLVAKALKFAHPRDLEVVNSTLAPTATCHGFSFTLPRHDTLAAIARTRLDSALPAQDGHMDSFYDNSMLSSIDPNASLGQLSTTREVPRGMTSASEIQYHGVTLTCWMHVDAVRLTRLKQIKKGVKLASGLGSVASSVPGAVGMVEEKLARRRNNMPWMKNSAAGSEAEVTGSETETGATDSEMEGPLGRRAMKNAMRNVRTATEDMSLPMGDGAEFDDPGDVFWLPYCITLVSRFPIYDTMQDFLRLSQAKLHMSQVLKILNAEPPRPGERYHLTIGLNQNDETTLEGHMPGALDFDKGLVKVDMQLWPLFQALDIDHILFCIDVALSNSGRVVFCSKHVAMLNIAVSALKYIVEMRGWEGIALPVLHARDSTLLIEDPGPYIIGLTSECRYVVAPPAEVVVVDLDTKSPPANVVTPKHKRDKARTKIRNALGPSYPVEKSIPMEFKVSYPTSAFRNFNKIYNTRDQERPRYLGDRFKPPGWWKHAEVLSVFDKVMHDKVSGISSFCVTLAHRLVHYVETRDDLELKVARINRRLLKLMQEGEHWKQQFETFEKYADRLAQEANELKTKIDKEKREARRLSNLATEQGKAKVELEDRLKRTEDARAEAMRQLSDMNQMIQELERDREEIMDVFETQINGVLQHLPPGSPLSSSRATTPAQSINSPAGRSMTLPSRGRPLTQQSNMTSLSQLTGGTVRSHVMDALDRVRAGGSMTDRSGLPEGDKAMFDRSDAIAHRIMSIQAKLELALNSVTGQ